MLKQRIITAVVLILLITAALYYLPFQGIALFISAIFLVAAWEWANLCAFERQPARAAYVLLILLCMLLLSWHAQLWEPDTISAETIKPLLAAGCTWWAVALLWVKSYPASATLWGSQAVRAVMGAFVLIPCWLALIYLSSLDGGIGWLFYMVAIVVAADTGAYFTGRAFGKSKLLPAVSPGKSWAGFWGGVACTATLALVCGYFFSIAGLSYTALVLVSVVTGLASVLGDLLESMLKRHRGVKDSSQLLPGHGGVLDRIDSMTAAAPLFTLLVILLG